MAISAKPIGETLKRWKETAGRVPSSKNSLRQTSSHEDSLRLVEFLKDNNPDKQLEVVSNPVDCYMGDYPAMSEIRRDYGDNAPTMWLMPQIHNLCKYCGAAPMTERVEMECAAILSKEFYYLNTAEFMLFFYQMKTGRFGQFYGSIDPVKIAVELRKFVQERNETIERLESEQRARQREEERKEAVSYTEYLRMKESGLI